MLRLRLEILAALAMSMVASGCGYANEGLGPPDIGIGPVAPLQMNLVNPTDADLFVDWSEGHAHFRIVRAGQELVIDRSCRPLCSDGCACLACDPGLSSVRRIPARQSLAFEWPAVHFLEASCGDEPGCACFESWPLTAGKYEVEATAYSAVVGGVPSATDPDLIVGASIQPLSPSCTAHAAFSLAPSAQVEALFDCHP